MSEIPSDAELARLVELARRQELPELAPFAARRMVREAVERAERPRSRPGLGSHWAWAAGFALVLGLVAVSSLLPRATTLEVAANDRPLRVALRSGDSVVAAPGAALELVAQVPARRQLRLARGAALFDVVPLAPGQRFEVETAHARIRVRGTVFSVEVLNGRTVVRVYEGIVYIEGGGSVKADQVWVSGGAAPVTPAPLDDEARAAAEARGAPALGSSPVPQTSALPSASPSLPAFSVEVPSAPGAAAVIQWEPRPAFPMPVDAGIPALDPAASEPGAASLETARAWLLAGKTERALQAAQAHPGASELGFRLLEADALRALGRFSGALEGYEQVAAASQGDLRAEAGYHAAWLALHELRDAARALASLDRFELDADASPLRERASVLRVDALLVLGRVEEARQAAERYLRREPETSTSRRLRALTRP